MEKGYVSRRSQSARRENRLTCRARSRIIIFLWHAYSPPKRCCGDNPRASARTRGHPIAHSRMRGDRSARRAQRSRPATRAPSARLRAPRHARTRSMGSRLGGAAVSNTDGRGFDTFRACSLAPDTPVPDTSTLTTAQTSSSEPQRRGSETGRSRHGAQLPVEQPSRMRHRGFDSLPTHQPTRVTPDG